MTPEQLRDFIYNCLIQAAQRGDIDINSGLIRKSTGVGSGHLEPGIIIWGEGGAQIYIGPAITDLKG